jgi:TonB family protein
LKASNAELRAHALAAPRPAYTELGRKARVTGTVVVELRLSERGEVEGVCLVKGLPMGLDRMALLAARRWTFQPFEVEGKRVRAVGRLAFEFGWFLAEAETADAPYSSRK